MAQTQGLVQRLKVTDGLVLAWAYIGPTPDNTELLIVKQAATPDEAAFRGAIADALGTALSTRQQVLAVHDDNGVEITMLQLPAP